MEEYLFQFNFKVVNIFYVLFFIFICYLLFVIFWNIKQTNKQNKTKQKNKQFVFFLLASHWNEHILFRVGAAINKIVKMEQPPSNNLNVYKF